MRLCPADPIAAHKARKHRQRAELIHRGNNTFAAAARAYVEEHAKPKQRRWPETARLLGMQPNSLEPIAGGLAGRWYEKPVGEIDGHDIWCAVDDPEPLIAYLEGNGPLADEDRQWLASLIEQYDGLIKRKLRPNGRPSGSITPKTEATKCASCLVRIGKTAWCRTHGRKRAPKALTQRLIKRAIELMEAEIPKARGKISAEAVKDGSYLRPDRKTEEYISDGLEEAKWEIIELALE